MLDAFISKELLSNIPVQIESICTHEDRLFVGTKQVKFSLLNNQINQLSFIYIMNFAFRFLITQLTVSDVIQCVKH